MKSRLRNVLLALGLTFLISPVSTAHSADKSFTCANKVCSITFDSNQQYADWIVPEDVYALSLDITGAPGGTSGTGNASGPVGRVYGLLDVIPGSKVRFAVGGAGQSARLGSRGGTNPVGHFAGGGGGIGAFASTSGGGGGAASVVFYRNQVLIAGGGGGGNGSDATGGGGGGADGGAAGTFSPQNPIHGAAGRNLPGGMQSGFIEAGNSSAGKIFVTYTDPRVNVAKKDQFLLLGVADPSRPLSDPRGIANLAIASASIVGAVGSRRDHDHVTDKKQEGQVEDLDTVSTDYLARKESGQGFGDRLPIWRSPLLNGYQNRLWKIVDRVDHRTPLLTRLFNDGAYLRASIGSLAFLLPAFSLVLGIQTGLTAGWRLTPDAQLVLILAVIGVFDAFAGALGFLALALTLGIRFSFMPLTAIEYFIGLAALGLIPTLAVGAFRPFRRTKSISLASWWERITDFAVIPFFTIWSTASLIGGLAILARHETSISNNAQKIALAMGGAFLVRLLIEEFVSHLFPQRLGQDHPVELDDPSLGHQIFLIVLRTITFLVVAISFLGNCWQVWVATLIMLIPQIVGLVKDNFPNFPNLWQVMPGGVPGIAFNIGIGTATAYFLIKYLGETEQMAKLVFVLAPIPGTAIGLVKTFGRHAIEGDVRWYRRPQIRIFYRIIGPVIFLVVLKLTHFI